MKISIAICTWNRDRLLEKTLGNLCDLKQPDCEWELLVIDNNSNDTTEKVIRHFENRLPIKYFFEPVPGLSNARNKAIDNANGNYIIWTDDDVLVDHNWLISYFEAFKKHPHAAVFGGP